MRRFVLAALLTLFLPSAYCDPHAWRAIYCTGVLSARDEVVESLLEVAKMQPTEDDRKAIEFFVAEHRDVKGRLERYLRTTSTDKFGYMQELGMQDVEADAARRLRCDREHRGCTPSEASVRLSMCNDLWWLP